MSERLQKFLAAAGVASRRACEDLIRAGRVKVNGETALLGVSVDPAIDQVEFDGQPVVGTSRRIYLMLNKPAGYITTVEDPQGRPTVMEFLPPNLPRLFPVGRLDKDTEGLLLFTDDGPLAHELLHPSKGVRKVYHAWLSQQPTRAILRQLEQGVELDDGPTAPCKARMKTSELLELEIKEGRKRQVRRMLKKVGYPVVRLRRVRFGPLHLTGLKAGQTRFLRPEELDKLRG